jgi:transposase
MISPETRAEICRLVKSEHMTVTQTAKILGVHHSTVQSAIERDGRAPTIVRVKRSALDQYADFIVRKLDEYPDIAASNIWRMLRDRGYGGSEQMVRHRVAALRGRRQKKAYLPLTMYPGDEAQVDWAHFGSLAVGRATRKLSCFVMVLAHSRALFARFFFDQTLESFLEGHVQAFQTLGGVPRQLRYDNLRAAVAERCGQTIRYNPQLLEMAGYYAFKPSACNPHSGNEKGRVERSVRYIREGFFVGKQFRTIDQLNAGLSDWIDKVAMARPWPDDRGRLVREIWHEERGKLIPLPENPYCIRQERVVRSGKVPFIRFDRNDYSIPFELVGQALSLSADFTYVTISHETRQIARHARTYSAGEKIINQEHFQGITASRPGAETVAARHYLTKLIPESIPLFSLMVERGVGIGPATAKLFELMRTYGTQALKAAIMQAVARSYGSADYVAQACEQMARKQKEKPRTLPIELGSHVPGANIIVTPHDVSTYDNF